MVNHRKKSTIVFSLVALTVTSPFWGGCLSLTVFRPAYLAWVNAIPFDAKAWREDAEAYPSRRLNMVADLRRRHRLEGMTVAEIETLLGPPSAIKPPEGGPFYEYDLGADPYTFMLGPDDAYLLLRFRNGKVVSVWQETG